MKVVFHVMGHKTLGHLRIIENIIRGLNQKPIIVADNDLEPFIKVKVPVRMLKGCFPYLNSGGNLYADISNLVDVINEINPDLVVFLALFPAHDLPKIKCRKWLISWEYRDTEQAVFLDKGYYRLFDKIFYIDLHLPSSKKMHNMHYIGPIMPDVGPSRPREGILVTVGGGGFGSANALRELNLKTDEKVTVVKGPFYSGNLNAIDYVPNMVELMQKSRLVISEAGYTACNELIATKTPCILVPGWRDNDDQERRARYLEKYGAVVAKDFRDLGLEGGVADVPVRLDGRKGLVSSIEKLAKVR